MSTKTIVTKAKWKPQLLYLASKKQWTIKQAEKFLFDKLQDSVNKGKGVNLTWEEAKQIINAIRICNR